MNDELKNDYLRSFFSKLFALCSMLELCFPKRFRSAICFPILLKQYDFADFRDSRSPP